MTTMLLLIYLYFLKIQFYENSIDFCKKAISLNSNAAHSYQNLATCYFHLSDMAMQKNTPLKLYQREGEWSQKFFSYRRSGRFICKYTVSTRK